MHKNTIGKWDGVTCGALGEMHVLVAKWGDLQC